MWHRTRVTEMLGIPYPIVQGPFGGGLSSVALTSTVSNAGGLGSFGGQPFTAAELVETCAAIRSATDRPFNLNLWVGDRDARLDTFGDPEYRRLVALFQPWLDEVGIPSPERPADLGPRFEDQVEAIFDARPHVFSFVFGIPSEAILDRCRTLGIRTVGAATTVDEALALDQAGVDAIVATGMEAGGHRVSFLRPAEESITGTLSLIPQVVDAVRVPVIAAGGIADARGLRAALTLGAEAVQIGTAFLATRESNATDDHRERLFSSAARDTTPTRVFSGRLARGLRTPVTESFRGQEHLLAPYPLQGRFLHALRMGMNSREQPFPLQAYWAGQSASLLRHRSARELMSALIERMDHTRAAMQ
ncbi:MAG: nitronate monooxygenase [Gemmatimonadales bacterium]|nr:nitronate monooxygenase [Gemmatimonadales bacterium]